MFKRSLVAFSILSTSLILNSMDKKDEPIAPAAEPIQVASRQPSRSSLWGEYFDELAFFLVKFHTWYADELAVQGKTVEQSTNSARPAASAMEQDKKAAKKLEELAIRVTQIEAMAIAIGKISTGMREDKELRKKKSCIKRPDRPSTTGKHLLFEGQDMNEKKARYDFLWWN